MERKDQHKNEKSNSKSGKRKEKFDKKKGKTKMINEKEELVVEISNEEDLLPKEFEKEKKLTMWLAVIIVGFGIITMIAATAPKSNASATSTRYDLDCLTSEKHIENPLNECR